MPPRYKSTEALGIEGTLWAAANKLRGKMDAGDYKHVTLGLLFLKCVDEQFLVRRSTLDPGLVDDPGQYQEAGVFWLPPVARWSGPRGIVQAAKADQLGQRIDAAMTSIEATNPRIRGVLPKNYSRPELDIRSLSELVTLIDKLSDLTHEGAGDVLGRVYEYFLGQFAASEARGGGEFYTPRSVVRLLVEVLQPYFGRVYDPACGSGGMFVQAEQFLAAHGGAGDKIAVYGQESNPATWKIARMNLELRGIPADLGSGWADTFHEDRHPNLQADYVLANPPFNISDWGGERLQGDARWRYGQPPSGNANFAWLQHVISKLAPQGTAGVVLANGSMSSRSGGEDAIRARLVQADLIECMVALPGQLFYSTAIPACLWFISRDKSPRGARAWQDRRGEILFIDARQLGVMTDRAHRDLLTTEIDRIARTHQAWRKGPRIGQYEDELGFCANVSVDELARNQFDLTPGRYVGAVDDEEHDAEALALKVERITVELTRLLEDSGRMQAEVLQSLTALRLADQ